MGLFQDGFHSRRGLCHRPLFGRYRRIGCIYSGRNSVIVAFADADLSVGGIFNDIILLRLNAGKGKNESISWISGKYCVSDCDDILLPIWY